MWRHGEIPGVGLVTVILTGDLYARGRLDDVQHFPNVTVPSCSQLALNSARRNAERRVAPIELLENEYRVVDIGHVLLGDLRLGRHYCRASVEISRWHGVAGSSSTSAEMDGPGRLRYLVLHHVLIAALVATWLAAGELTRPLFVIHHINDSVSAELAIFIQRYHSS